MLAERASRYTRLSAVFIVWLVLTITGCQLEPAERILFKDFEAEGHQVPPTAVVSAVTAHSGSFAAQLDASNPYAAGWNVTWGEIGVPHKIRVQAWVYLPNGHLKGALVMEVKRGEALHYWQVFDIHQVVKRYHQWEPVHRTFVLPRDLEVTDQVRFYAWNYSGGQTWYLDDVAIERVE